MDSTKACDAVRIATSGAGLLVPLLLMVLLSRGTIECFELDSLRPFAEPEFPHVEKHKCQPLD